MEYEEAIEAFKKLFNMDACAVDKTYSEQLYNAIEVYEKASINQRPLEPSIGEE